MSKLKKQKQKSLEKIASKILKQDEKNQILKSKKIDISKFWNLNK